MAYAVHEDDSIFPRNLISPNFSHDEINYATFSVESERKQKKSFELRSANRSSINTENIWFFFLHFWLASKHSFRQYDDCTSVQRSRGTHVICVHGYIVHMPMAVPTTLVWMNIFSSTHNLLMLTIQNESNEFMANENKNRIFLHFSSVSFMIFFQKYFHSLSILILMILILPQSQYGPFKQNRCVSNTRINTHTLFVKLYINRRGSIWTTTWTWTTWCCLTINCGTHRPHPHDHWITTMPKNYYFLKIAK